MYVTFHGPMGFQVHRVDGRHATLVAVTIDAEHATRIADLLDRHGMTDVPIDHVEAL